MGRKHAEAAADAASDHSNDSARRPRRVRKFAVLLAVAGGALYLIRRNQRRTSIDEGVWHDAPNA